MLQTGDILRGKLRTRDAALHFIIYLNEMNDEYFEGAMLTHDSRSDNIRMSPDHFELRNDKGEMYLFQYDNTYVVGKKLLKRNEWGPFMKIGQLSVIGTKFIVERIGGQAPLSWEDYSPK